MVLTQLQKMVIPEGWTLSFPYHYGSHATSVVLIDETLSLDEFPYHYGSHATDAGSGRLLQNGQVSIPLWFSRNGRKGN